MRKNTKLHRAKKSLLNTSLCLGREPSELANSVLMCDGLRHTKTNLNNSTRLMARDVMRKNFGVLINHRKKKPPRFTEEDINQ